MSKYVFKKARFITTAIWPKDYPVLKDDPGHVLPEIAVAGRSNVGKSSLFNHLFESKGLVKTSSVPGRPKLLTFLSLMTSWLLWTFLDMVLHRFLYPPKNNGDQWWNVI